METGQGCAAAAEHTSTRGTEDTGVSVSLLAANAYKSHELTMFLVLGSSWSIQKLIAHYRQQLLSSQGVYVPGWL